LKVLKPSFGSLENPFLINVIENGWIIVHPIVTKKENFEIELLELLKDEDLKQYKNNCHNTMDLWKNVPILKYPNIKNFTVKLVSIFEKTYS